MKIKELQELKNSLIAEMKALTETEDAFNKDAFDNKEKELKDVEDKILALEKIENVSKVVDNKKIEDKEGKNMEFKNEIMSGREVTVDFRNEMKTTNVEIEKIGNGKEVIERAQENPILDNLRVVHVVGTEEVAVQKQKLGKLKKVEELAKIENKDVLFSKVPLRPQKRATIVPVSEELLDNAAFNIEATIRQECRESVNNTIAELVVTGDDTFFGLEKATKKDGAIEVKRKVEKAVSLDDINGLYFGLDQKFRKNAIWVMNDADFQHLMTLTDTTGRPIVHCDLAKGLNFVLYGRPVVISNDATKVYFVDMAQAMIVAAGKTAQIKKSTEAMFDVAGVAFRVMTYIDVKPALQKAIAYMA